MKKSFVLLLVLFIGFFVLVISANKAPKIVYVQKLKIAACPTCYKLAKDLNPEKYEIIPTKSTAESVDLLQSRQVDMILAGRTLKPDEPQYNFLAVSDGYSFLSSKPKTFNIKDLKNFIVYTDLDSSEIKALFNTDNVIQVADVYHHINEGIVVTSWENTDYTKAEMIHLLNDAGERVLLARQPLLYCPDTCGEEASEIVNLLNSTNLLKGGDSL